MVVGAIGLALGYRLYSSRRRTDVIYRRDGETWIQPNAPPHDVYGDESGPRA